MNNEKMFTVPGIKSSRISAPVDTGRVGQTADWSSIGQNIAQSGDSIAAGIQAEKTNLKITEGQLEEGKKPVNKLQSRIDEATAQGKDSKAARLQGRKDRRDLRDDARAERIKTRNEEQKAQTQARQDKKDEKFADRREDNNVPITFPSQVFDRFSTIAKKL